MTPENPLLRPSSLPFEAPDFEAVREEHFLPAFEVAMREQLAEVAAIGGNLEPPTFENTLAALERSGQTLARVQRTFAALTSAHATDGLQEIEATVAPRLAAHGDDIFLDDTLFRRVDELWLARDDLDLSGEEARLLDHLRAVFVRAGARLAPEAQARVRAINSELSSLATRFRQDLLQLARERAVLVDRAEALDGLDGPAIRAAAAEARARGHDDGWLLRLVATTRQPPLAHLTDRGLRERLWKASAHRGLGENGGIDTRPLVRRIAELRAEFATLLGYPNWAAWALERQMAVHPDAARSMLEGLVPPVLANVATEAADIEARMRAEGVPGPLEPWDWEFFAERVRKDRHSLEDREIRPYLEFERVLADGVFFTMERLFGITFRRRHDLPVYHPDVRSYDVVEANGELCGLFYLDPFARDTKRGGAWMSTYVAQSRLLGQKPVIVNVLNLQKPADGEVALLTFDEVTTLFHEMGHAVHGLLSDVSFPSLAGTAVARDFVEFPSTFQEDWAFHPDVLANYARHCETGDAIPGELLERILAARRFNQGYETLEYLAAALLDLGWHTLGPADIPADPEAFEAEVLARHGVALPAIPPRYRSTFFPHVFGGGYSARYYAYMWSEVLAADAFAFLQARNGLDPEDGRRLRESVLSRGNSGETMQMYVDFRGAEPTADALLARRGLVPAAAT
ncbi:MAG: M3 family peptidase [Gemmatimonadales bacterium]|nr:MAG: M3 family peptidase [Gemmatimonadales bacterium]